jgi:hypothetical protein
MKKIKYWYNNLPEKTQITIYITGLMLTLPLITVLTLGICQLVVGLNF